MRKEDLHRDRYPTTALGRLKEKLLTVAVFMGIFLPVRLFFYSYVSDYWIGSFGLMTGVFLTIIFLSQKGKLGWLGRVVHRQVLSFAKGKYGTFAVIQLVFFIFLFSNAIYGIENPPEEIKQRFVGILAEQGVTDLESMQGRMDDLRWTGPGAVLGPFFSIIIVLTPNPVGHAFYSIVNDMTDGWLLHFITVFLVEDLEVLGLVIYFKYLKKAH